MTTPATFQELFEQRTTSNLEKLRELVALGVIRPAIVGDTVTIDRMVHATRERCAEDRTAFYCLPCHQRCANAFQLAAHLESAGGHLIARDCRHHGLEEL